MSKKKVLCFIMAVVMCLSLLTGYTVEKAYADDSLVLHLKFDGNLTDASGKNNNAECTYGNITYEEGIFGQSAVFNGKSYLEVADNTTLDLSQLTISLWAYKSKDRNLEKWVPYVYKEEDEDCWATPYQVYEHWANTPSIYMHDNSDDTELNQFSLSGRPVDYSKWFLLTVTYDGKEARIYENDILIKKQSVKGAPTATVGDLYIGLKDGEYFFEGMMDDLRIYNRALSAGEVEGLFKEGMKESPERLTQKNDLVAHYKFNDNYEDATEYGNNAEKVTGKVTFIDGVNGKAAKFSKNTYLEVDHNESIDFDEGFTVTTWVVLYDDDQYATLLNKPGCSTTSNSDDFSYRIHLEDDHFDFEYVPFADQANFEGFRYSFDNSIRNKWTHVAVSTDTKEIRWYVNGKLVYKEEISDELQNEIAHSSGKLMIGSDGEYFFNGAIDELKLYNYELTPDQIKADYNNKDSLSVSADNANKIKLMSRNATVSLSTYRKYIETGSSVKLTSGVTYSSSNKKIFTVDKYGKLKAVGKGSAKLTIKHGGLAKTYTIKVK